VSDSDAIPTNQRTGEPLKWATYIGDGSERYHGVPMRDLDEADRKALEDAGETALIAAVESGNLYRLTPRAKAEAKAEAPSKTADVLPEDDKPMAAPAASSARPARAATSSKDGDS